MAMVLSIPYSGFPSDVEPHQSRHTEEEDGHEQHTSPSIGSPSSQDSDNDALMDSVAQQGEQQQLQGEGMTPSSSSSDIASSPLNAIEKDVEQDHVCTNDTPATEDYWNFPSHDYSNDYVIVPHQDDEIDESMNNMDIDNNETDPLFGNLFQEQSAQEESQTYGGLSNLGNTCYMASALQMLASLNGSFVQDLKTHAPPVRESNNHDRSEEANSTAATPPPPPPLTLRDALLEVLDGLSKGETVRPEAFKRCIDERTGLFLGYRQQDSHEFLTTLLDLLDEEYKKKDAPEEAEQVEEKEDVAVINENEAEAMEQSDNDEEEEQVDSSGIEALAGLLENDEEASIVIGESVEEDESAMKKPRSEEEAAEEEGNAVSSVTENADEQAVRRSSSLINLGIGDIEELLHGGNGDAAISAPKSNHMADRREGEHKCKLVGGRMNTSQAELTRYDKSKHFDLDAMAANNDSFGKREATDERMSECSLAEVKSPVESNFTTEVRVSLTCESCKYRRSHTETYLHLSLELGADSCSSIDECVRKFFAPEKRDIKCEKCFHSSAMQTTEITKLPKVLLFHLKRFIVDVSPDYTSISYRKNQSPVSFEESIPLEDGGDGLFEEFLAPDVVVSKGSSYAIRSVVNHIGASASCGHYTADAKREYEGEMGEEHREWTRFNDSYVSKITSEEAVVDSKNTAYMIMYELEK